VLLFFLLETKKYAQSRPSGRCDSSGHFSAPFATVHELWTLIADADSANRRPLRWVSP
jgi:hypothetical protein